MILKNVSRYYPDDMPLGDDVQYFRSEDGIDFYDSFKLFKMKYKLCIDTKTGVICFISEDVSGLYPAGYTVVETDTLPDGCDTYGGWMYENEVVKAVPVDFEAKAESERQRLLSDAATTIEDWRTELNLNVISEEDKSSLILWLAYIKKLKSLNFDDIKTQDAFDAIDWPVSP